MAFFLDDPKKDAKLVAELRRAGVDPERASTRDIAEALTTVTGQAHYVTWDGAIRHDINVDP